MSTFTDDESCFEFW